MKTLWTIQHDLLQAADCCLGTTAKTAINQAVADITTVQDALEEALDQAWDAPNPDAAKPHIQTCYTLAHLGTRLSKRTQALYDAKCQVEKVKTKLQATDPEAANTLAEVVQALKHQIITLP